MAERRSTLVWHDIQANIHIDVRDEYEIQPSIDLNLNEKHLRKKKECI